MTINRHAMVDYVDLVIANTTDARHIRLLEVLRAHMIAEAAEDVDALLATISHHRVQYRTWGSAPELDPGTREEVAEFYRQRKAQGMLYFQFDIDRLTISDDIIITDGVMTSLLTGATLATQGYPGFSDTSVHEVTARLCISWPFDDSGLLTGEETYTAPTNFRTLEPEEVPADFAANIAHTQNAPSPVQ